MSNRIWQDCNSNGRLRTLFIGNGCNLLSGDLSWLRLLQGLSTSLSEYPHNSPTTTTKLQHTATRLNTTHHNTATKWNGESARSEGVAADFDARKPFSMVYEELYLKALRKSSTKIPENEVKHRIAKMLDQLPPNDFHQKLVTSGFHHILTTNYDYNLEKCCGNSFMVILFHF